MYKALVCLVQCAGQFELINYLQAIATFCRQNLQTRAAMRNQKMTMMTIMEILEMMAVKMMTMMKDKMISMEMTRYSGTRLYVCASISDY